MNTKSFIQYHQLLSYFVFAYGITWSGIFILLVSKGFDFTTIHTPEVIFIFLMMFLGPSMSSLILNAVLDGRSGLSELWMRFARWKVSGGWYAVALLTIPLLLLAILSVLSATVSPTFVPSFRIEGIAVGLLAGSLEEIGWTGFATPRLLKQSNVLTAGCLLGLLWSFWHMLADFSGNISAMGTGWILWFTIFWIVPLTAYRILMTWVYSNTQSLLVAQLMHASYTGWLYVLSPAVSFDRGLLWQTIFATSLWAIVAIVFASKHEDAFLQGF
jgi:membrane protease YdiL (CAAX protease family)